MNNDETKKKKGDSTQNIKVVRKLNFKKEVIEFYSRLGLVNLPDSNNKLTMFPYEPFQTSVSSVSEAN